MGDNEILCRFQGIQNNFLAGQPFKQFKMFSLMKRYSLDSDESLFPDIGQIGSLRSVIKLFNES